MLCLLPLLLSSSLVAQTPYPFGNLGNVAAELNVRTNVREKANNRLLSVNIGWDDGLFGLDGYDSPKAKAFMRQFRPVSVRFPHGVWSNWYDWEADKPLHRDNYDFGGFDNTIAGNAKYDWTFGFKGLTQLHNERKFDVLWTYSLLYNDATQKAVRRMKDSQAKGFDVTHVELGNEHFWKDQRSNRLKTPQDYLAASKEMSAALKRNNPGIKLSITPSWRRGEGTGRTGKIDHTEYNRIIKGDGRHFDAVTMHRYLNAGKGGTPNAANYRSLLTSPLTFAEDVKFLRSGTAAGKEVWLTEWGVSGGYRAASYLGMADAYLYLFDNQSTYKYANWFQIHGTNNFFRQSAGANGGLSTAKTGFGSVYEILRGVFQDATLLGSDMTTKTLKGSSKAVVARAVERGGKTEVMVVNKTNKSVKFTLKFNGGVYRGSARHEAMVFRDLSQDIGDVPFGRNPLKLIREGNGTITLPPYSISVLSKINVQNPPPPNPNPNPNSTQRPYAGAINLPGVIQAENFDKGGQGVAYNDADGKNIGTRHRQEGVDVQFGNNSGLVVGWTVQGEWLEYTVNVPSTEDYNFEFVYSGTNNGMIRAELPDRNEVVFNGLPLLATGSWDSYTSRQVYNISLPKGRQVLRFTVLDAGFNLDRVIVTRPLRARGADVDEEGLQTATEALSVFPNPSTDGIFELSESVRWEVFSLTGSKIATGEGAVIDMSSSPAGTYILRADDESRRLMRQ